MTDYQDFDDFIRSLKLKHFEPHEFRIGLSQGNVLPPEELWHNIVPVAKLWDLVRSRFGPVHLTSAYRSPSYNVQEGGFPNSQHLEFAALDGSPRNAKPEDVARFVRRCRGTAILIPSHYERRVLTGLSVPYLPLEVYDRRHGTGSAVVFRGGVGLYDTFVHIDTRGTDADWGG